MSFKCMYISFLEVRSSLTINNTTLNRWHFWTTKGVLEYFLIKSTIILICSRVHQTIICIKIRAEILTICKKFIDQIYNVDNPNIFSKIKQKKNKIIKHFKIRSGQKKEKKKRKLSPVSTHYFTRCCQFSELILFLLFSLFFSFFFFFSAFGIGEFPSTLLPFSSLYTKLQ